MFSTSFAYSGFPQIHHTPIWYKIQLIHMPFFIYVESIPPLPFISRPILSPRERFTLPYPPPIHRDMTVRHRPILSTAMPTGALLSSRRCVPLSE